MSAADTGPSWSDIAAWYDDLVEGGSGPHETAMNCLLELVPDLHGAVVLDIACGQGIATRALAKAGASRVVGVDASERMIDLARRRNSAARSDVSYVVDDAQRLAAFDDHGFDGVTCQLGLMDITDLDATLSTVRRVARPGGWFVFVIGHPCFLVPDAEQVVMADGSPGVSVTGYFEERFWRSPRPNAVRRVGNYHRTLSTYLNAALHCGFRLERVAEPMATPLLADKRPLYTQIPIFFAARVRSD
jgi:ubiquinone/menaquinone biosynthesis C-methylase UbiE